MPDLRFENWDDLRLFLTTVREGSVAAAARSLAINPTTVTRRMQAFEERLGSQLFDRLRGGVVLSPLGELVLQGAEQMQDVVQATEIRAAGDTQGLTGPVRVAVQEFFAEAWAEGFIAIAKSLPGIDLQVLAGDSMHSLSRREADIALRMTREPPEHLVGRRFYRIAQAVYGAPSFKAEGLQNAPWLSWSALPSEQTAAGRIRKRLGCSGPLGIGVDSYGLLMRYARAGAGLVVLPCAAGEVDRALVRYSAPERLNVPAWVLTHPDLRQTPRIRAVMNALGDLLLAHRVEATGGLD